ncbi:MAG: hypothetical protein V4581_10470 [Bacteroidota bacterium]
MSGTNDDGHVIYNFEGATDANIQYHTWKITNVTSGNGDPEAKKPGNAYSMVFALSGTYKVQHRVVGRVGGTNFVSEQTLDIVVDIPEAELGPNIISSPNFETASDWTVLNIASNDNVNWSFGTGTATVAGTTDGHKAIYQAVQVEAGEYQFDMNVSGPGSVNTWFEIYISSTAPTQNSDYSAGGKRMQLNTWGGCATSAFNGLLSVVGCGNDVSGPLVTFTAPGTVYFVIKSGSSGGSVNSINVSNVTMQKTL